MKTFKSPLPSNLNISSEQSDVKNVISHIRKFISRRTNNTDDVDDLVQEALLRTLNRNDASELENFQAYINQVAKSVMYSDWQKNKNQPTKILKTINFIFVEQLHGTIQCTPIIEQ